MNRIVQQAAGSTVWVKTNNNNKKAALCCCAGTLTKATDGKSLVILLPQD